MRKFKNNNAEILSKSAVSFIVKISSGILTYFLNIYITNTYGLQVSGVYFLLLSIIFIASGIVTMGVEQPITKLVAMRNGTSNIGSTLKIIDKALLQSLILGGIAMILLILWANVFYENYVAQVIVLTGSIFALSTISIVAAALQGLKKIFASSIVASLGSVLVFFLMLRIFSGSGSLMQVVMFFTSSSTIVALLSYAYWRSNISQAGIGNEGSGWRLHSKSNFDFFIISILNTLIVWVPNIIVGLSAEISHVAIYNGAMRSAMLLGMIHITVSAIMLPKFAETYAENDITTLKSLLFFSIKLMLILSSLPAFGLFIFAEDVMLLFTDEIQNGGNILRVLIIGQLINILGATFYIFNLMTGSEGLVRKGMLITTLAGGVFTFFGIEYFGFMFVPYGYTITVALLAANNIKIYSNFNRYKYHEK
jgi:O-antigen/teichoic acid export membrane protein